MSEAFNPKNYSCNSCKFKAKSKAKLADHAKSKHKEKCSQCNFATEMKLQLNWHKEAQHSKSTKKNQTSSKNNCTDIICSKCKFAAKSEIQLKKHTTVRHGTNSEACWFWSNGFCNRNPCMFAHPKMYTSNPSIPCRYQQFCRKPNCPYTHNSQVNCPLPCRYGTSCENTACRLDHRNTFLG